MLALVVPLAAMTLATPALSPSRGPNRLVGLLRDVAFPSGRSQRVIPNVAPGFEFNEAIPSWSVGGEGALRVEIRIPKPSGGMSKWYSFGTWSRAGDWTPRASLKGQRDAEGNVSTDTFETKLRPRRCDVRLTLMSKPGADRPKLKHLSLAFSDTTAPFVPDEPNRAAWGHHVDVPQRAQNNYPHGGVLCSATSTSMLLWHYSKRLGQPQIDRDVPQVEASVWDKVYNGAGNWPFNAAYFGSFPGLVGYVARLDRIADLETLTSAGYPVACSVSFDLLRGKPLSAGESGHLIVVVGFDESGDVVVNDPAFKDGVRKTYPRGDFQKGWDYSHHVVYLDLPEHARLPRDPKNLWTPVRA